MLFHREGCLQINLGGLDGFMPKPQRNHGTVDTGLEKVHGHGVTQAVNGNPLVFRRRAHLRACNAMFVQQVLHAIYSKFFTFRVGKEHIVSTTRWFLQPGIKTVRVALANGVQRFLRPFPTNRMCAPVPATTIS